MKMMRYLTTHVGVKGRGWRLCLAVRVFDTLTAHTHGHRHTPHAQATLGNTSGAFCLLPVILRVCLFLAELQMASPPLSGSATPPSPRTIYALATRLHFISLAFCASAFINIYTIDF